MKSYWQLKIAREQKELLRRQDRKRAAQAAKKKASSIIRCDCGMGANTESGHYYDCAIERAEREAC